MNKKRLVVAIFAGIILSAAFPNLLAACRWRIVGRCINKACQRQAIEPAPREVKEQAAMNPQYGYASQLKEMTERARWCEVRCDGLFVLKTEKLRKPLNELVRQASIDFKSGELDALPRIKPDFLVHFLDEDGNMIGIVGFWTRDKKLSPTIALKTRDIDGTLGFDDDAIRRFKSDIKPTLHDFRNNCEALTSGKKALVNTALEAIAQDPFRDQTKKAIALIEPYLRSEDSVARYCAARSLLRLVPNHKEAKRVLLED